MTFYFRKLEPQTLLNLFRKLVLYPNFALFFNIGEDEPRPRFFFQVSRLRENQKKGLHQKWNTFFPANSGEDPPKKRSLPNMEHFFRGNLRSDAHQSQIVRRDADEDHTQIIGGDTVKSLG